MPETAEREVIATSVAGINRFFFLEREASWCFLQVHIGFISWQMFFRGGSA